MSQQSTRFCSNCGTAMGTGQRFCANCGATVDAEINRPTDLAPMTPDNPAAVSLTSTTQISSPGASTPPLAQDAAAQLTPPPPPDQYIPNPYDISSQQPALGYQPPLQSSQSSPENLSPQAHQSSTENVQPIPDFARPQEKSVRPGVKRRRAGLLTIALLAIALLGVGGYFAYAYGGFLKNPSSQKNTSNSNKPSNDGKDSTSNDNTSNTNNTGESTPASPSAKTTTFAPPLSFIYSDVKISITDVKQAQNFPDDDRSDAQSGVLRVNLKEENAYSSYSSYYPTDAFSLLLPSGTTVQPVTADEASSIQGDASRTNWIDFAVATNVDVSTLVLQVGKSTEAQLKVPLKANADLSKYQPKVVKLNQPSVEYGRTTWTATQAEAAWSFRGKQAEAGKMFVTVTFKIDNNSSTDFVGSPSDYIRLESGQTRSSPTYQDVPISLDAQQTGQNGTATFVMPQDSSDFTVILLGNESGSMPAKQDATLKFQIK